MLRLLLLLPPMPAPKRRGTPAIDDRWKDPFSRNAIKTTVNAADFRRQESANDPLHVASHVQRITLSGKEGKEGKSARQRERFEEA